MTSYGPPNPPYPPGGGGYGPPNGGYGPPGGGYGPPAGPLLAARPAASLWPIVVITLVFALFGLIPTVLASNKASERRESTSRYWITFVLSLIGSIIAYAILFVLLFVVLLAGTFAAVDAAAGAIPSINTTRDPVYPTATSTATGTAAPTSGPCAYLPTPGAANATTVALPEDPDPTPTGTRTWTLVTSAGTIVVRLDGAAAPCTVQSIVHLTELGFYDSTPCPRTVDQGISILQCGDPTGTGAGGPGYTFADEDLAAADYSAGAVAMANSGPDSNGSQFFLVDQDSNASLAKSYTVFGTITSGQDVLAKIVAAGNDGSTGLGDGRPTTPVTIKTATVS